MAAATGIAAQGISAAIVNTAISKISTMINDADNSMVNNLDDEVNAVLRGINRRPKVLDVSYSEAYGKADGALSDANLDGASANVSTLPLFLDGAIGSFFDDYLGKMDYLFPGLSVAGGETQAVGSAALNAPSHPWLGRYTHLSGQQLEIKINDFEPVKQAIIMGTVMASFNVEDFSINRIKALDYQEIRERYSSFRRCLQFGEVEFK